MQHQLSEQSFTFEAFDWEPECESIHHETDDADMVDHHGEARFWVTGPCRHTTGFRCEAAALSAMLHPQGWCDRCRSWFPRHRFVYTRLGV